MRSEVGMAEAARPLQLTARACALAAAATLGALALAGHWQIGLAASAGLLLGAANPYLTQRSVGAPADFRLISILRLGMLSTAAIGLGALQGWAAIVAALLGLAAAQLTLSAASARELVLSR